MGTTPVVIIKAPTVYLKISAAWSTSFKISELQPRTGIKSEPTQTNKALQAPTAPNRSLLGP